MPTTRPTTTTRARNSSKKPPVRPLTPAQLSRVVRVIGEPSGTARFGAGKALIVTAEKFPERVYPHFDAIASLLRSESKIMRWTAMLALAPLAEVDADRKIDTVLDIYIAFIHGGNLITAANAVKCLARIARDRPDLLVRVLAAILDVENATYETPECRRVAIGQTLKAIREMGSEVLRRPDVTAFIRRQVSCPRAAVAKLANQLLRRL